MVWKSREQKLPPPSYFSLIVEHLQRAYRGARISRELMQTLQPFFIEAWRNGKTAEGAAQSTCSCNGREVVPSPVIGIHVARGEVRPPKGAQRGEVFGADELRPPAAVERLERALRQIEQKQRREESITTRWKQREQTARKDFVRAEAAQRIGASTQRYAELKAEAERIDHELKRVRSDLRQASRTAASTADTPVPAPVAAEKPRTPRRRGKSASDTPQAAAMLSSIRGLLPDVATQLAAQIKKESGRS